MPASLPGRPDLGQLRRQAKELRDAARRGDPVALERVTRQAPSRSGGLLTLAAAQLVIAREQGFASWPRLRAAIVAEQVRSARGTEDFLAAAVEGRTGVASRLFDANPAMGEANIFAAAALGDADRVARFLTEGPEAALAVDDARGWPPLLYACYSHWHRTGSEIGPSMVQVARLLLDAGASPNTNNGRLPNRGYRSALHGSVVTNKPGITRLLLERGAGPNDGVSLREAASLPDHSCLRLLLDHGARVGPAWPAVHAAATRGDAIALRLLLEAVRLSEPAAYVRDLVNSVLPDAANKGFVEVVETLLSFGADPNYSSEDGSALRQAVRAGHPDVAGLLLEHGAVDDLSAIDRFLGACARAQRDEAERLLVEHPGLIGQLSGSDQAAIVEAAGRDNVASVALMVDLGLSIHARNNLGETALHAAAYAGRAQTVSLLLERGAEVDARDANFDATPLAFATVGSGERPAPSGDWVATVRALLDAGASREGVWLSGSKAPSEDVAEVLGDYGVTEEQRPVEDQPSQPSRQSSADPEMVELAQRIRTAYDTADLDLFASLLHPEVHWAAGPDGCTNRSQVLAWYQRQLDRGARGQVTGTEIQGNTIVVCLAVAPRAEGARPGPPDLVYQALTVRQGLVVNIDGVPGPTPK